jgi:hypothetical protein
MTIQAMRRGIFARADEVVRNPDNATIGDVAVLILAILILLATGNGSSLTANHRPTTEREARHSAHEDALTVLISNLKLVFARVRFYKHYLVARRKRAEVKSIEGFMRDRVNRQFIGRQAPIVDVKMRLLKHWERFGGIIFEAPIAVVATIDDLPAFGMAFEVKGNDIRIRQLHGVRGFSTRGHYHPLRPWPRLFVESCQDLALTHGYSRVLVVRSNRSYSLKGQDAAPETPEGIRHQLEIRSRLMKRLDGTAQSIQGFEMEKNWWVWHATVGNSVVEVGRGE